MDSDQLLPAARRRLSDATNNGEDGYHNRLATSAFARAAVIDCRKWRKVTSVSELLLFIFLFLEKLVYIIYVETNRPKRRLVF